MVQEIIKLMNDWGLPDTELMKAFYEVELQKILDN